MKKLGTVRKLSFIVVLLVAFMCTIFPTQVHAAKKAKFYYKTYDKSQTFEGSARKITSHESYKRVVLKGDSKAIKKINKTLKKICNAKIKEMNGEYAKGDVDWSYDDQEYAHDHYYNVFTSEVTYNARNVISIRVAYDWYQGGVADYGYNCYTFSLKTGKLLSLVDVCDGNNKELTKEIKEKLLKKYGNEVFYPEEFDDISAQKCDFYLEKDNKAIVSFDKYEIASGADGTFDVELKSNYK